MANALTININENVLVRELLSLAERVIKVGLKLKSVTQKHIGNWRKTYKSVPKNGPPTLGVGVADGANTKDVFGR